MSLIRWALWALCAFTLVSSLYLVYHALQHGSDELECPEAVRHAEVAGPRMRESDVVVTPPSALG